MEEKELSKPSGLCRGACPALSGPHLSSKLAAVTTSWIYRKEPGRMISSLPISPLAKMTKSERNPQATQLQI